MKGYREYKKLDLIDVSNEILEFWKQKNIFYKSIENRKKSSEFVFFEGPPSANGLPGIHHVMARTIKDVFCRYHTLKGKKVIRKAGWDTHGLPIELSVEKELGITKENIGKEISISEYNKACKNTVIRYTNAWNDLTQKIGYWIDLKNPYFTYDPKYMESVWWLLKQIYNQKRLYKGYTVQPYSPKAGTGLSSHEINQTGTYHNINDTTVVAQFKIRKEYGNHLIWKDILQKSGLISLNVSSEENEIPSDNYWRKECNKWNLYFLAWTTTPWTLPSNTALAVGPFIEYVLIKTFNQYTFLPIYVILAKSLINKQFGENYFELFENFEKKDLNFKETNKKNPYQIIATYIGKDLVGIRYEQLLPWATPYENLDNAFQVIEGDFVTIESGTGIVHIAPTFGSDDALVAKQNNIPSILIADKNKKLTPLVNLEGKFIEIDSIPENFRGKFVKNEYYENENAPKKSVDVEIVLLLKNQNQAFKIEKLTHSYPHCWRTDKPILYYPLDSWFIKVNDIRENLINLNQTINWQPKSIGENRFGGWLENVNDWNLSRSRFWGIPLPIWRTEDNQEEICIGSVEELILEINKSIQAGFILENPFRDFIIGDLSKENYDKIDLHKHIVDSIVLISESGKPMYRESDLIDVWFDSGAMPYAQTHYPFEEKKVPLTADFIAEGIDQTRGWFYTLHVISSIVFNQIAYKNVICNGLVLDKTGQKMSKRLGNTIDPFEVLNIYGADAIRWYMISNSNPWENLKFNLENIDEVKRKFFRTLYNTYSFFVLYANIDGFTYHEEETPFHERSEIDRWILSELNLLIKKVDESYANYESTYASRLITNFVCDHLSNWYIRLSRRRFWKEKYSQDKISSYQTLYRCLEIISILSSPIAPFYSDRLFQDLNQVTKKEKVDSVHLMDFPICKRDEIDELLIERIRITQKITSLIFSLRKQENIKVRQPLKRVLIPCLDDQIYKHLEAASELIKQEVNIKEIIFITEKKSREIIVKIAKPNFKILGPKFGKKLKSIEKIIINLNPEEIFQLENEGKITIDKYEIQRSEVEIVTKDIPGWLFASEGKLTVALDVTLNNELMQEGIAREFINRIQNLRKKLKLDLTDRINIEVSISNSSLVKAIMCFDSHIKQEVLALNLTINEKNIDSELEIELNEEKIKVMIIKL